MMSAVSSHLSSFLSQAHAFKSPILSPGWGLTANILTGPDHWLITLHIPTEDRLIAGFLATIDGLDLQALRLPCYTPSVCWDDLKYFSSLSRWTLDTWSNKADNKHFLWIKIPKNLGHYPQWMGKLITKELTKVSGGVSRGVMPSKHCLAAVRRQNVVSVAGKCSKMIYWVSECQQKTWREMSVFWFKPNINIDDGASCCSL